MRRLYLSGITLLVLVACGFTAIAQNIGVSNVAITPDDQAILELRATNKGVLLPRMTTAQATTLASSLDAGDDGMMVYDTDIKQFKYWDGSTLAWIEMPTPATIASTSLDDAYNAGGAAAGRVITYNGGAVEITGTGQVISLITDGDIQLTADDTWVGSSPSLQRLRFDDNVGGRIHVEDADLMIKEARYIGMDGSSPRIQFYDGAPGEIDIQDANVEIDAETWLGVGSSVERIEFQGSDNEINLMGVTGGVGIGTNAPDDNLHVYQNTNAGVGITIENPNTSSSSSTSLVFDYAGTDYAGIYSRSENYSGAPDYLQIINNHGAGSLIEMVTNGGSRMTINDAGIVALPSYSGASAGVMVASTTGVLSKNDYSGSSTDVLTGDGNWTDVSTIVSNDGDWTVSGNEIYNSNSGNVGIGIAAPTMKLEVSGGNVGVQGSRALVIGGPDSNTPDITPDAQLVLDGAENAGYNLLNTKLLIRGLDNESIVKAISVVDEDDNELFFIQSQAVNNGQSYFRGNVGIGTTSPSNGLHVSMAEGSGSGYLGVGLGGGASGNSKIEVRGGSTPYLDFANDIAIDYDARLRLISDNQIALEGASLGVGNTNPQEALDVTGNVRVSSLSAGGNVQADGNGNLIISNDIPDNDLGYIWNQNASDQAANFRINGWGETYGLKINAPDGEKIQFTSLGANGSKIRHTTGWALDYHAGPGNSGTTGSHRFYTTSGNTYRDRMAIESTGRVTVRQDIGNDPAFTGLESPETANGRAQLVLSSSYSDLVIASSEGNNNHGSTVTFATYNPANSADYRKFVVNQGNWGSRAGFLDFGFADAGSRANPHLNINATDNVVTMDGYNKRVGIFQMNPQARLHVRSGGNDNPDSNGIYVYNEDTGGDNDDAIVTTRVNGASAGDPFFSMDVNGVTGWSVGLDNSDGDKLKFANSWSNPGTNTRMTVQTDGNVGIGTTTPDHRLEVNGHLELEYDNQDNKIRFHDPGNIWYSIGTDQSDGGKFKINYGGNVGDAAHFTLQSNGNIGLGGTAPAVRLAVGGNGVNQYATDLWVENNAHVQGNETLNQGGRGRMRVGTAWGYMGLYTDGSSTGANNDLVLGASSALVRVGPDAGGQNLKVSGLEGTGNRPVHADASGILRAGVAADYTVASNLAYSFDDVGWTSGTSGDDTQSGSIGLGFNLRIFGNTYSNVYLGTNGYMLFGNGTYIGLGNGCLPSGTINTGSAALLFWWDDLICNSFQYRTVGTAPNRVFQARYDGYQFSNTGEIVDCMIMIHEGSDMIVVRYDDVGCCGDDAKGGGATFGLQGAGGASAQAIPVGCNAPLTDDNQGANASQFMSFRAPN